MTFKPWGRLHRLDEEAAKLAARPEFTLTPAQDRAMDCLVSDALYVALGGGSRCVSGDTLVDGTGQTIEALAKKGDPVVVNTTYGQQVVDPPFYKGDDELLEFKTESGRTVKVTSDHRFWDGHSWAYARDVSEGIAIAVSLDVPLYLQTPQDSSRAPYLSASLVNGRHLRGILANLKDRYFAYRRRYDLQLRPAATLGLSNHASLSDEPARTREGTRPASRIEPRPGLNTRTPHFFQQVLEDTPSDLSYSHHSKQDVFQRPYLAERFLNPVSVRISESFQGLRQIRQRVHSQLNRLRSSLLSGYSWLRQSPPCVYHESFGDTPNRKGYKLEKVLSVSKTPKQSYYTFHVPGCEQYFANGVLHHNSGKTFLFVRAVLIRALKEPGSRHAIFRFTFNSIKASIIYDTLPKVIDLCFPPLKNCSVNKTDWVLRLPNKSEIWFGGLDDKERTEKILGQEYSTIYFNECSQIPWNSVMIALTRLAQKTNLLKLKAYFDFNPPSKRHWCYMLFVEKRDPITKQPHVNPLNYAFFLINPADNRENLSSEYLAILESLPPKQRDRFLLGKFADDSDGALWTLELLAQNRRLGNREDIPEFLRIVVAVDPSGCKGEEDFRSDEIGIAVCALGTDSHGYLIEDLSGRYSPEEWGEVTAEAFRRHKADCIVGEVNFGGDMVRAIIHAQDADLPYKEVRASRGKVVRAEPVSNLYEQNKIHHVGHFPELEDQMCNFMQSGYVGLKSPDRCDAAIWGFTELFPGLTRKREEHNVNSKVVTRKRSASRLARG